MSSRKTKNLDAFGDALAEALRARGWSQGDLGRALGGVTQSAISAWRSGQAEPSSTTVFAAERTLKVPPGTLSRHLGYLPLESSAEVRVLTAIDQDPQLSSTAKRALIALYKELIARPSP